MGIIRELKRTKYHVEKRKNYNVANKLDCIINNVNCDSLVISVGTIRELKKARYHAKKEKNYNVADKLEYIINIAMHHKIKKNAIKLINS